MLLLTQTQYNSLFQSLEIEYQESLSQFKNSLERTRKLVLLKMKLNFTKELKDIRNLKVKDFIEKLENQDPEILELLNLQQACQFEKEIANVKNESASNLEPMVELKIPNNFAKNDKPPSQISFPFVSNNPDMSFLFNIEEDEPDMSVLDHLDSSSKGQVKEQLIKIQQKLQRILNKVDN